MKSTPLDGSPDWLSDVVKFYRKNKTFNHSCHKTDPKADGFTGAKKKKDCAGRMTMILNDFCETPGKNGVYKSIDELVNKYLVNWLGRKAVKKLKKNRSIKGANFET